MELGVNNEERGITEFNSIEAKGLSALPASNNNKTNHDIAVQKFQMMNSQLR
jgi:hypothetical protein